MHFKKKKKNWKYQMNFHLIQFTFDLRFLLLSLIDSEYSSSD